ncbi:hypothetical protein RO3G_17319 [Rhizopus delemar RA 99-880]|uniref:Uncharacterized protein n=1 Tax=Rhizopus delemar (strain RA 99-880 / ATCC MYA-4621 / FGSC 9543 / NRRL 43880) TaxID=246409 RepID=I1CVX8_RHIO9|nr:hypothetical protein RO3G_17319 [Rhizopus delemar RA 99-880]|eukprot:EIE92608.1 hypothetical protein RO3G_17319 [Rhizopus delemar RA 99-880]
MAQATCVLTYWAAFLIDNLLNSCRHAINVPLAKLFIKAIPYFFYPFPKLIHIFCSTFVTAKLQLQLILPCASGRYHAGTQSAIYDKQPTQFIPYYLGP